MMFRLAAFVAAMLFSLHSLSAPITVHNTGVDSSDALVASGAQTAFWTLQSAPVGASQAIGSNPFRFPYPAYTADTASAAWVAPYASLEHIELGFYVYQLAIDLTGFDLSSVAISGQYGTDNNGFIRVNGGADAATTPIEGFTSLTNFSLTSGFHSGINTIEVGVYNLGDPTAFFVQFASATGTVPEPAALALLGLGLAGLAFGRRRKQQVL